MTAKTFVITDLISRWFTDTLRKHSEDFMNVFAIEEDAEVRINVFYVRSSDEFLLMDFTTVNDQREYRNTFIATKSLNLKDARSDRHKTFINDNTLAIVDIMFHETVCDTEIERHVTINVDPHLMEITLYRNKHNEIVVVFRDGASLNEITRFETSIMTYSTLYRIPNETHSEEDEPLLIIDDVDEE